MRKGFVRFWTEGLGSFLVAVGIALFIRWALVEAYVIPSGSMLPTLLIHDHIFVNKVIYGVRLPFSEKWLLQFSDPDRGEVVVFKYPQDPSLFYIKRIIGIPGDRVFYENGNLYVNEQVLPRGLPQNDLGEDFKWLRDEDFPGEEGGKSSYIHWQEGVENRNYSILNRREGTALAFGPYIVPRGHYFVMGDNRDNSRDSRLWEAHSTSARGFVEFSFAQNTGNIEVPAGTIVKTSLYGGKEERFKTLKDVTVGPQNARVEVKAVSAGALGNVEAGRVKIVEGELAEKGLMVNNPENFDGGRDYRFVPREFIVGRAMFVWLSCEQTLSFAPFLCDPRKIRWGRIFHSVK